MIHVSAKSPDLYDGEMLVYLVMQPKKNTLPVCSDKAVQEIVRRAFAVGDFIGKESQTLLFYPEVLNGVGARKKKYPGRILVVGLGKEDPDNEMFRKAGGTVASIAKKNRIKELMLVLPEKIEFPAPEMTQSLAEGLALGAYQFVRYKNTADEDERPVRLEKVLLSAPAPTHVRRGALIGDIIARAANRARDMANEPGNSWTPGKFAEAGRDLAAAQGFTCKILGKAEMKKLGMGGILGVSQGSAQPPTLTDIYYRCQNKKAKTILLVGKGLTFDSGGISLKPGAGMQDMKYDKSGGAAVMAVMQAIGEIKPAGVNVAALIPASENMPGSEALKPGDIITHYNGKTCEVINTDAEGRLILADALAYGVKKYMPDLVIDIATLTGAAIIALGHHRTCLMSNNDQLVDRLVSAGESCGEPLWRLPLGPEYARELKSEIADLKNVGANRAAGTIVAGCFLQEFVGETPWAHLDVAGTAWDFTEKSYIPKGPSAVGVRTLIELIRNWK